MIRVKQLREDARIPTRAHHTDAGLDLYAIEDCNVDLTAKIRTGIAVEIPKGHVGLILPRSSMSGAGTITHVGVIDSGYCGEIIVVLSIGGDVLQQLLCWIRQAWLEANDRPIFNVKKGDRVAQLVIVPCVTDELRIEQFEGGERGANGFGSTGR